MERQLDRTPNQDLRTRMEGQLEVIERAVVLWEAAATELDADSWHLATRWPELNAEDPSLPPALEALERRVRESPDLPERSLLERLSAARRRVERAAAARLDGIERPASVWHPSRPSGPALADLRRHLPILFLSRSGWQPALAWSLGAAGVAVTGGFAVAARHWAGLLLPLAFVGGWLWIHLAARASSRSVTLTSRALVVGRHSMPLEHLTVEEVPFGAEEPRWEIVFRPPGAREVRVRFVERPVELIARLRRLGVPVGPG